MYLPLGKSPEQHQNKLGSAKARALFALLSLALAVGILVPSHGARAGVVFVQSASTLTGGVASVPVSFSSNVTVGDVIAVFIGWGDLVSTLSITDTCGAGGGSNTYTLLDNPTAGAAGRAAMAYAVIGKSGACTVTANLAGGTPSTKIIVHEVNGVNTSTPIDGHKITHQVDPGTGIDAVSSGNIPTTQNGDYIFGASIDGGGNNVHFAAGTGYAAHELTRPSGSAMSEDKVQPSAGSIAATFTGDQATADYLTGIMAFQPAFGTQVGSRSDTLSDSRPSATSNQSIAFTTNTQITGSSTITVVWPTAFKVNGFDCGDIDAATSSAFNFNYQGCNATATAWGASLVGGNNNFVQGNADLVQAAVDHFTVAFKSNVTAGNLIVVAAIWDGSATALSVTDTLANVYTAVGPLKKGAGSLANWNTQLFYAKNIQGGAASVTIKLSAAATSEIDFYIHEYSGADLSAPLDVTSVNVGATGTADSGSATTHSANELIFGFEIDVAQSVGAGSGFEQRSNFVGDATEDKIVRTVGSYNATVQSGGGDWVMWMAAFKITPVGTGIMLTAPTDSTSTVHVATGTPITIKIGSNATVGQQGGHWITNPSAGGVYTISVGGTFGGSGNMLVSINAGVSVQAVVAESLALTVNSVAAGASFPRTGVLDNFNRADENPLGNGTWTCPLVNGNGNLKLVSNTAVATNPGTPDDCYWSAATFGPDTEAYVTISTKPANGHCISVQARISGAGSLISGYWADFCANAGTDTWDLYRADNGALTHLGTTGNQELTAGDSMGLEVIGNSIKIYYKPAAGSWTVESTASDATYSGSGRIALHVEDGAADNFGGGSIICAADDGATVNQIGTAATSVPFGIISSNTFYQGCQDLIVSTNAGNGYSVTVQESSAMRTADGRFSIPDTTCDAGLCTSASSGTWVTPTKNGLGHTCADQVGHDCAGIYSAGTKFRQFANVAAGISGIGFVQGNFFTQGSVTQISVTFSSNVTANNIITAEVTYDTTVTLTSITAPCVTGNFTLVDTVTGSGSKYTQAYAVISGSGSCTATANFSGTNNVKIAVQEIAGINSSNPLDNHAMQKQVGPGTGTDAVTSGNITTTANGDYIFGVTFDDAGTNPTFTAGTGYTARVTMQKSGGLEMEDKIQPTAGSVAATFTSSNGNDTITGIMAFKASAQTGEVIMASSTPATATGRIKFRLSAGSAQPAGAYTTMIMYTILGTF